MAPFSPTKSMIASAPWPSVSSHGLDVALALDLDRVVGAGLGRESEPLLVRVEDDDLGRRHRRQALDADMAEAAGPDHHRARSRGRAPGSSSSPRGWPSAPRRPALRSRRARRRVEPDHRARAGEQERGEAAVAADVGGTAETQCQAREDSPAWTPAGCAAPPFAGTTLSPNGRAGRGRVGGCAAWPRRDCREPARCACACVRLGPTQLFSDRPSRAGRARAGAPTVASDRTVPALVRARGRSGPRGRGPHVALLACG